MYLFVVLENAAFIDNVMGNPNPFCTFLSCFPGRKLCICLSVYTNKIVFKPIVPYEEKSNDFHVIHFP